VAATPRPSPRSHTERLIVKTAAGELLPQAVQWPDTIPRLVQKQVLQGFDKAGYRFATGPNETQAPSFPCSSTSARFRSTRPKRPWPMCASPLAAEDGKVIQRGEIEGQAAASIEPQPADDEGSFRKGRRGLARMVQNRRSC
jgi:hypothetical protein